MDVAIITTTINLPVFLTSVCTNVRKFGHNNVSCLIAGDNKSPRDSHDYCHKIARKYKVPIAFYSIKEQDRLLAETPALLPHLPHNSKARRSFALWQAYRSGAGIIVTMDDDNYVLDDDDFISRHSIVGKTLNLTVASSDSGWHNVCAPLKEEYAAPFFHRGHPLSQRSGQEKITHTPGKVKIMVNAGLWLGDPDIDAITRLSRPLNVTAYKTSFPRRFTLAAGTWAPFNSQNTALHRELVPAYFLSEYLGRYRDIWPSYLVRRIADHLGHSVCYGLPLVRQDRNQHNLLQDLREEMLGMELTDAFTNTLRTTQLSGNSYTACAKELVGKLQRKKWYDQKMYAPVTRFLAASEAWAQSLE